MPAPGGYCTSFCGVAGDPCDGVCAPTVKAGDLCLARCSSDADCRTREHYACDPQIHACVLPGMIAMQPRHCPAPSDRDPAWTASAQLTSTSSPGIYQFEPATALASDGSVVALYIGRGRLVDGNTLGIARALGTTATDAPFGSDRHSHFDPWLVSDRRGELHAVWLGFDGRSKHQQIAYASSKDRGATWTPPISVNADGDCKKEPNEPGEADDDNGCLDKPMIAVGPDPAKRADDILYAMYSSDGLRVRASRDRGKTWSPPVTALDGIYGTAAVGRDGKLHLATLNGGPNEGGDFGSTSHTVDYASSSDGGATFTKPSRVSAPGEALPFFFSNPAIAVDDKRGWIYVAYTRGGHDGLWDIVVAASRDGQTWTRTRIGDDPACATHMVPNVALDPTTGTLHVAWYDSRGEHGRFAHATCPAGAATCTQTGAINDVPFGALTTVRHASTWIGEYEGLLVDDRRRVLHAVWTEPVTEGGAVVSRIFHATTRLE